MKVAELEGAQLDYWVARAEGWEFFWSKHDYWSVKVPDDDSYTSACRNWTRFDSRSGKPNQQPAPWEALDEFGYSPATDWAQGGPIIEREGIAIYRNYVRDNSGRFNGWIAALPNGQGPSHVANGETPLLAAMRAFVLFKFGNEVQEKG